jgi:monovalent cation/hydrogen antiporter
VSFFESLLALLFVAVGLLQVSRWFSIPYPTMLAAAGVVLALVPGTPTIELEPATALALFIAPALFDAAFEFPIGAIRQLWRPLVAFAFFAVVVSTIAVAGIGVYVAGLPLLAAVALGAIVAPPDAAAATAILGTVRMPRRTVAILKGESLLNDATALLIFSAAVALQNHGGVDSRLGLQLGLASPGGLLLGFALSKLLMYLLRYIKGVLSAYLLEYLFSFGAWIIAAHLGLSSVLCVVAFAMSLAQSANKTPPRVRLHNIAVSHTLVFLFNVLAFLLMGFQARSIVNLMTPDRLHEALKFAGLVVGCLIGVRMAWALLYNRLAYRFKVLRGDFVPSTLGQGVLAGWSGMRGLVTLATAFVLPASFPQRDLIVITAFTVVLATLVIQGLTLAPLVRLLHLDGENGLEAELSETRADMAATALSFLNQEKGASAAHWRFVFDTIQSSVLPNGNRDSIAERRRVGLKAMELERQRLEMLRLQQRVGPEAFAILQEDLDFAEAALTSECDRRLDES